MLEYDLSLLFLLNGWSGHWAWFDFLVAMFTKYGPLLFCLYVAGLWFSGETQAARRENREQALYACCAAVLTLGVNQLIGGIWFRNRPYVDYPVNKLVAVTANAAFPSDHAGCSFAIAGSIYKKYRVGSILLLIAGLLSLSRVYAGVHYPSDIIGGMLVGLLSSMVIHKNKAVLVTPIAFVIMTWERLENQFFSSDSLATRGNTHKH